MTMEEFGRIVMAIRTYYPREKILPNQEAATLWYEQLQDLDYQTTSAVLKKWVATEKWSPSIAEIREKVSEIRNGDIPSWSAAWEKTRNAVRHYGRYNPKDALDSLDELTREVVKRLGYYDLCASENHDADRANFRMIYEQLVSRKRQDAQIPVALKAAIDGIRQNSIEQKKEEK